MMAKYKVILPKLNIRTSPVNDLTNKTNIIGIAYLNYSFEGEEVIVNGEKWYTDRDGYFYWGEGVTSGIQFVSGFNHKESIAHFNTTWLNSNGRDTIIVLIDTGVSINNEFFNSDLISEVDLTDHSSLDKDHGTFICGIVAGLNGPITGISPQAKIVSIRFKDENTDLEKIFDNLIQALKQTRQIKNSNPQAKILINISQGFNQFQVSKHPNKINEITQLIKELAAMSIVVFCAAGENMQLVQNNLLFPASLKETISIGCITSQNDSLVFAQPINLIMPFHEYDSYNTNHVVVKNIGSSFSVAVVTSIAALILSTTQDFSRDFFMNEMTPLNVNVNTFNYESSKCQFFIANK